MTRLETTQEMSPTEIDVREIDAAREREKRPKEKKLAARRKNDAYYTPSWCVDRLLETGLVWLGGDVLEPCAGDGAIVRAAKQYEETCRPVQWTTMDIDPSVDVDIHGDFLKADFKKNFDLVITNPPFSLADAFAKKCLDVAGQVIFLLRLSWLASQKRHEFFAAYGCPDVYVLPNRPSFTCNGKTDRFEYAWFHWHLGTDELRPGAIRILDTTPRSERCAR